MSPRARKAPNQVRIIGGEWRGRKLVFPDAPGLRPTPDRVRETLFNWLQPYLPGARCLDLFAGTGVLAMEALSRGAAAVTLVERDLNVSRALRNSLDGLGAGDRARLCTRNALDFLHDGCSTAYDIVFIDPPYGSGLLAQSVASLDQSACLDQGGLVYMEHEADAETPVLPENWLELKHKRAGQVSYYLLRSD